MFNKSTVQMVTALTLAMSEGASAFAHGAPFGASSSGEDVLYSFNQWFLDKAAEMPPSLFWSFVRVAVALEVTTILCSVSFRNCRGNLTLGALVSMQWTICILAFLLTLQLPLTAIRLTRAYAGIILAVSLLAIAILPWRLSWLLVPTAGPRKILGTIIYGGAALIFLIALIN